MLHEAVHALAHVRGVKDTSRGGKYHTSASSSPWPATIEQPTDSLSGHLRVAVACPAGHLPNQGVRIHPPVGRLYPPASVQGVRGLVLLGLTGGLDGPLDQPRRPLPAVPDELAQLGVDPVSPLGKPRTSASDIPWSSRLP
jgi:hypothetical protein